jgi:hypothetical protein
MITRSSFTNYTGRAVDALEGLVFRKDPSVTVPARYKPRLENITNGGYCINTFSKKVFRAMLTYGRAGVLLDALPTEKHNYNSPRSMLPYLSLYTASNIINWRMGEVDGEPSPDQIVLREYHSIPQEFGSTVRVRHRVLQLDEQGRYRVRLYDQSANGDFYMSDEQYPRTGSGTGQNYLNKLPFVFINPVDLGPDVYRSPILDLVDANLAHFQLEAEYRNALHYSAHPTLVISGWPDGEPGVFRLGGNNALVLPEGCTAHILEFHGHGLEPLEHALAAQIDKIAEVGARLVQNSATGPETAEAARIRQHSQTSVISSIARTASDGIQSALDTACKWALAEGKVSFEFNQDYIDVMISPQMLAEIVRTTREGLMTRRDAVWNMVRGEITEPGKTVDQIVDALETETPTFIGGVDPAQRIMQAAAGLSGKPLRTGRIMEAAAGQSGKPRRFGSPQDAD